MARARRVWQLPMVGIMHLSAPRYIGSVTYFSLDVARVAQCLPGCHSGKSSGSNMHSSGRRSANILFADLAATERRNS